MFLRSSYALSSPCLFCLSYASSSPCLTVVRLLSSPCIGVKDYGRLTFLWVVAAVLCMALSLELVFWDEIIDRILAFICSSSYWSLIWWFQIDTGNELTVVLILLVIVSYIAIWLNAGDCWWAKCMTRQRLLCLTLYTCWKNMVLFRMVQDPTTLTEGDNSVCTRLIFSMHLQPKTFKGRFMNNVCLKLYT